eukprot:CAMPEP_0176458644 /NCGR_PEP_ID=MMETSP0127-20121128/32732_1 /TAXON_ID=938130 /ORGANISM="Platyophrya macrostoma, Strain WH" /LENGTH=138 /DNA_ID=CAMNT_0017849285 /DNA_START=14 /DNA_END=426 /DNA_ORIENTATION=+
MQQLCVTVGLPIPVNHHLFRPFNNNMHLVAPLPSVSCNPSDSVESEVSRRLSDAYAVENIYLHAEDSQTWKSHLKSTVPAERLACAVRRRISLAIYDALRGLKCFYCWLPSAMCICDRLLKERQTVALACQEEGDDVP